MHLLIYLDHVLLALFTMAKDKGSEIALHDSTLHICSFYFLLEEIMDLHTR